MVQAHCDGVAITMRGLNPDIAREAPVEYNFGFNDVYEIDSVQNVHETYVFDPATSHDDYDPIALIGYLKRQIGNLSDLPLEIVVYTREAKPWREEFERAGYSIYPNGIVVIEEGCS